MIESDDVMFSPMTGRKSASGRFNCAAVIDSDRGGINTLVKKKHVLTSDDAVCIQHRSRNEGAISRDWHQSSTRSQEREGSVVASDDATSASMTRTRVNIGRVTRLPQIGIIRQHASTSCRRRNSNDGSLLWTDDIALGGDDGSRLQGARLSTSRE